jgi:hypothetical protein
MYSSNNHSLPDHRVLLNTEYCWTQNTAEHRVLLNPEYCWTQNTAEHRVLLNTEYCWTQNTAEHRILLNTEYCWTQSAAEHRVLLNTEYCWTLTQNICCRHNNPLLLRKEFTVARSTSSNGVLERKQDFSEFHTKQENMQVKGNVKVLVFYWLHRNLFDLYSFVGSHKFIYIYIYFILSFKGSVPSKPAACVDKSNRNCCGWQQQLCPFECLTIFRNGINCTKKLQKVRVKIKLSLYRNGETLQAPRISIQSANEVHKDVSPTRRSQL